MRYLVLFITILIMSSNTSHAGEISKEMANKYYQNCLAKESPQKLSQESQEFLCACTASNMMETMTTDDIRAMSNQQDPVTARQALNYMLINVYAPCMEYPAKDHYYYTCVTDPKTKKLGNDPSKICGCMANKVADHLSRNGKEQFKEILQRNPNIADPMGALENDPEFQNYVGKQVLSCVL